MCWHDFFASLELTHHFINMSGSSSSVQSGGGGSGGGGSTWDLRAQRRERQLWGECVRGLQSLANADVNDDTLDADASLTKVLDDLSTVRRLAEGSVGGWRGVF